MKKLIGILSLTAIVLATAGLFQSRRLANQQARIAVLKGEVEQQFNEVESLRSREQRVQEELGELHRENQVLFAQLQAGQAEAAAHTNAPVSVKPSSAPTAVGDDTNSGKLSDAKKGLGDFFSRMMQDPETKKVIRDQQRMMVNQLYAPLVKQLALSPEESETFKELLAGNMMKGAEKASALFENSSSSNRLNLSAELKSEQTSFDEQIKVFLGESRYALYKDYQGTVGERAQLSQFKVMTGSESSLTDQQTDQLLAIMKEERQSVAAETGQILPDGQEQANLLPTMSDEQLEKLLQSQEAVNQRVFQRASELFSPEQREAFGKFQTNQLQMMRVGMSMARKLFAPEKSVASPGQSSALAN